VGPDAQSSVACKLTSDQLAVRRQKLIPGLIDRAVEVGEVPNGLRLRFKSEPRLLRDLARVMEQEHDCCSFLRFELKTEPGAGPVTLEVTGPPGTAEMLRNL
jgi:hypothetical protein